MKKPLIVLTGPTAVGKTKLSISLAKSKWGDYFGGFHAGLSIYGYWFSQDSFGGYAGVRHHLVDVLHPKEKFHIVKFQQMAKAAMEEIYAGGRIPILVGGTGFYIQAITRDIDFTEAEQEDAYRKELEVLAEQKGREYLHQMLKEVDEKSAGQIHANNVKRVIRALEFYHQNGTPISAHNQEQKAHQSPYNLAYFVLNAPRELLYERIDRRVDAMLEEGFWKRYRN